MKITVDMKIITIFFIAFFFVSCGISKLPQQFSGQWETFQVTVDNADVMKDSLFRKNINFDSKMPYDVPFYGRTFSYIEGQPDVLGLSLHRNEEDLKGTVSFFRTKKGYRADIKMTSDDRFSGSYNIEIDSVFKNINGINVLMTRMKWKSERVEIYLQRIENAGNGNKVIVS